MTLNREVKAPLLGRQPSAAWMRQALDGTIVCGVTVAQTIRSTSSGPIPAASRAARLALTPRVKVFSSGPAMRRSRMPVRVRIHSSLVSSDGGKSSLRTT